MDLFELLKQRPEAVSPTTTSGLLHGGRFGLLSPNAFMDRLEKDKSFVSIPTLRDEHGLTPLHICASKGLVSIAQLLLAHPDTDINAIDEENGWTPLHRYPFYLSLKRPEKNVSFVHLNIARCMKGMQISLPYC